MEPGRARELYNQLVHTVSTSHKNGKVCEGVFGAMMDVALINDGPVTIVLDSMVDSRLHNAATPLSKEPKAACDTPTQESIQVEGVSVGGTQPLPEGDFCRK